MKLFRSAVSVFLAILLVAGLLPQQPAEAADANGYLTLQEAAAYVRKELAAFKPEIKVKFYFESTEAYSTRELWELLKAEVMKHTGIGDEGDYMYWTFQMVSYDAKDQFDGKTHYVEFDYIMPQYNNTAAQEQELEQKLNQVMNSLNLSGKSDYEKIKAIYEYVCQNVVYSQTVLTSGADALNPPDHLRIYYSAYAALVMGETTCQGFSSLIYRMMLMAGIDCRLITGDSHGWNIVKLDGRYYYLDPTWDSDAWHAHGELEYFLQGSAHFRTGGKATDTGSFSYEHKTWANQFNQAFLDQYPISVLDYGQDNLCTGNAGTVLGSGKCGDQANWVLTADGKLTISGTGAIWDTPNSTFWFDGNQWIHRWGGLHGYIKQIEIQEGITHIGMRTFMNCPQLTSVKFPASLESTGEYVFAMCENLTQLTLPNTIKVLGNSAFYQCVRLESVTISSGMQEIPENAFVGCTALKTVTIPQGVRKIDTGAFASCPSLQTVNIPASVTSLGAMAFAQSFDPSKALSFTVPATVTEVGGQCFAESGLHEITFNANVTNLALWMFNYCHYLRKVTLSDTIRSFTENTFYECTNLTSIKLPAGLTDLGQWPFVSCRSLQTIIWPTSLTTIPNQAFSGCTSLETLSFPDSLVTIEGSAFSGCTGLKQITIPSSVRNLGDTVFGNCTSLETVKFEGSVPQLGESIFVFGGEITVYYPRNNSTWTQDAMNRLMIGHPFVTFVPTHGPSDPHTPGAWQNDEGSHWQACSGCGEILEKNVHSYTNACDASCNICGLARNAAHSWVNGICTVCGASEGNPGDSTDPSTPQNGDTANPNATVPSSGDADDKKPNASVPSSGDADGKQPNATAPIEDKDNQKSSDPGSPLVTILLIGLAVAAIGVGGFFGLRMIRKKNKSK